MPCGSTAPHMTGPTAAWPATGRTTMARPRRTWPPQPDRVLAERAEVVEYRADGIYKVVGDLSDPLKQTWWLVPSQMGGGQVGDIGKVVYRVTPSSGLAYFIK